MSAAVVRAARVRSELDAIVVDNPRARQAHDVFDFLVAHGEHQGSAPKRCVLLSGPSQFWQVHDPQALRRAAEHA